MTPPHPQARAQETHPDRARTATRRFRVCFGHDPLRNFDLLTTTELEEEIAMLEAIERDRDPFTRPHHDGVPG